MLIPRYIADKGFDKIKGHPSYDTVMQIVEKNCYDPYHMVGGMVYRNMAIAYHKETDRNVLGAAETADFDFLVMGKPRDIFVPKGWRIRRRERSTYGGYSDERKFSMTFVAPQNIKSLIGFYEFKVDLVSIHDICPQKQNPTLQDYFRAVPLDIQAIAANPHKQIVRGPGIDAIITKSVSLQNRNGLIYAPEFAEDADFYAEDKADTMGFRFLGKTNKKRLCDCTSRDIFWHGCRCGGR